MWIANRKVKTGQGEKVSFSRLLRHAESRQVYSTLPLDPEGPPPAGGTLIVHCDYLQYFTPWILLFPINISVCLTSFILSFVTILLRKL